MPLVFYLILECCTVKLFSFFFLSDLTMSQVVSDSLQLYWQKYWQTWLSFNHMAGFGFKIIVLFPEEHTQLNITWLLLANAVVFKYK